MNDSRFTAKTANTSSLNISNNLMLNSQQKNTNTSAYLFDSSTTSTSRSTNLM